MAATIAAPARDDARECAGQGSLFAARGDEARSWETLASFSVAMAVTQRA